MNISGKRSERQTCQTTNGEDPKEAEKSPPKAPQIEIDETLYKLDLPDELKSNDHGKDRFMHDPNRVLLFRHFTDALVRVGYLKYGRELKDL